MRRWALIIAGLGACLLAGQALAAAFNGVEFPLRRADIEMIRKTEAIIADRGAEVGDEEAWTNPETGSTGRVKVLRDFMERGRDCKEVGYEVKFPNLNDPYLFKFSYCEVAEGEWKLYFR